MDFVEFGRSIEVIAERENARLPTDVIVFGMVTICISGNSPFSLLKALSPIEVYVLGMVEEFPSSDRRRRASALVKTVILGEDLRG